MAKRNKQTAVRPTAATAVNKDYDVLKSVKHDGVFYNPGDKLPYSRISREHAARLKKMGVLK